MNARLRVLFVHAMFAPAIEIWCTDPNGTRVTYEGQCWCGCCDPTPPNEPCTVSPALPYCPPYEYSHADGGNCTATNIPRMQPPDMFVFLFSVSLFCIFVAFVLIVRHTMHSLRRTHA